MRDVAGVGRWLTYICGYDGDAGYPPARVGRWDGGSGWGAAAAAAVHDSQSCRERGAIPHYCD